MNIVELDKNIFLFINNFVGNFPLFDQLIKLVVNEYFMPLTLSLILLYLWFLPGKDQKENRKSASLTLLVIVLTGVIITVSNLFFDRPRPFEEMSVNLLFYKPTDPSFPSNAAAVGFVLATSIFLYNKKFGIFALILAAFYAFSRVYAGVHYPLDVLAGTALGFFSSLIIYRLFPKFIEKLTEEFSRFQTSLKFDLN